MEIIFKVRNSHNESACLLFKKMSPDISDKTHNSLHLKKSLGQFSNLINLLRKDFKLSPVGREN